ncbi:MAG: right-handed parallel beta-helix repeat-containing protein [Thermodesulfobacteriota bacterium]
MNAKRILIFVFFMYSTLISPLWAATYYVDNAGSDSNAGTQQAPWRNCPGLSGWSGSATLRAGDVVYFNSSGTWTQAGSSALLSVKGGVTYDGSSWGGGQRATFRMLGNNGSANRPGIIVFYDDNPTIETVVRGFDIDGNNKLISGITVNWPVSAGSMIGATKRIENCIIHDFGDPGGTSYGIYGLKVGATKDTSVENVEIINTVVFNTPRSALSIYDAVTTGTHEIRNVLVRGCEVHNGGNSPSIRGNGIHLKDKITNAIVEYSTTYNNDGRGIFVESDPSRPGPNNIELRYNIVTNNATGGIGIAQPASMSVDIYGNLIFKNRNTGSGGSGIYFESNLRESLDIKIYNNTLFENANGGILVSSAARFTTFEIKNNILYSLSSKTPLVNNSPDRVTAHSNNILYRPDGGTLVTDGNIYQSSNLSSWESTALASNPLLKSVSSLPNGFAGTYGVNITPNTDGLNITTASPAKDMGGSLGSVYNGSINSIVRPVGAKWDVGAYEYGVPVSTVEQPVEQPPVEQPPVEVLPSTVLFFKAESGALTAPMQIVSSPDAPGGSYITTPTNYVGYADYSFNIVEPGAYKIVGEVYGSDRLADSFQVIIDNGPQDVWDFNPKEDPALYNVWRQDEVTRRGTGTMDAPQFDPLTLPLEAGPHTISFKGRENNARLAYFYILRVPGGTGLIEAESGVLTAPMEIVLSAEASGGAYVATPTNYVGYVDYNFNIVEPGTYKIIANVYGSDRLADSFQVIIDNGSQDVWDFNPNEDPALYNVWMEDEVTARGTGTMDAPQFDPLIVQLEAGPHTISFKGRENNARLDNFYLKKLSAALELFKLEITE